MASPGPSRNGGGLALLLAVAIAGTAAAGPSISGTSSAAIPATYRALYQRYGSTCPGLDWATLAAIGKVESDHGQSTLPGVHSGTNSAGAAGPMQFIPATFAGVRRRHPQIGSDIYDPTNAVPAAAWLLCDNGASHDLRGAIYSYNHSQTYVSQVLAQAKEYR